MIHTLLLCRPSFGFPSLTRSRSTWEPWENLHSLTQKLWLEKEERIRKNLLEKFDVELFYAEEEKVKKIIARRRARLARENEAPVKVECEKSEDEAEKRKRQARERLRLQRLQQVEDGICGAESPTRCGATPNTKHATDKTSSSERQSAKAVQPIHHDIDCHRPSTPASKMVKKKRVVDSGKTSRERAKVANLVENDVNDSEFVILDDKAPKKKTTRNLDKPSPRERQVKDQVEHRINDRRYIELVVGTPRPSPVKTPSRDRPRAEVARQVERDVPKQQSTVCIEKASSLQDVDPFPAEKTPSVDGKAPPLKKRKLEPVSNVKQGAVVSKRPVKTIGPSPKKITEQELAKTGVSRKSDTSLEASLLTRRSKLAAAQSSSKLPEREQERRVVSTLVKANTDIRPSNGSAQKPQPASKGAKGS